MTWVEDVDADEDDFTRWNGRPVPSPGDWEVGAVEFDGITWHRPSLNVTDEPEAEAHLWRDTDVDDETFTHRFDVWERDRDDEGRRTRWVVTDDMAEFDSYDDLMRKCYQELRDLLP